MNDNFLQIYLRYSDQVLIFEKINISRNSRNHRRLPKNLGGGGVEYLLRNRLFRINIINLIGAEQASSGRIVEVNFN